MDAYRSGYLSVTILQYEISLPLWSTSASDLPVQSDVLRRFDDSIFGRHLHLYWLADQVKQV